MKLYEIDELISKCVVVNDNEAVDTSTGEIIDIDYLEHLQMERSKKTEYLIKLYLMQKHSKLRQTSFQKGQRLKQTKPSK